MFGPSFTARLRQNCIQLYFLSESMTFDVAPRTGKVEGSQRGSSSIYLVFPIYFFSPSHRRFSFLYTIIVLRPLSFFPGFPCGLASVLVCIVASFSKFFGVPFRLLFRKPVQGNENVRTLGKPILSPPNSDSPPPRILSLRTVVVNSWPCVFGSWKEIVIFCRFFVAKSHFFWDLSS